MVSLPNAVGPPLGEVFLSRFGDTWFFPVTSIPLGLAVLLSAALTEERAVGGTGAALPLLQTALLPSLRRPFIVILVVGALYGLVVSYMAALLAEKGVPIAFFFTSFTIVLFGSRFVLMSRAGRFSRTSLLAASLGAMAVSYVLVGVFASPILVVVAGILFGLGYSVGFPTASVMVTEQFEPHQRTAPLALFSAMFSIGILLTPWFGTYLIGALGYNGLLYALAAVGLAAVAYLCLTPKEQQRVIAET